jgi:hypothetical protein
MTRGYQRVKQPLVISCRSSLEEKQGPLFMRRLQETEWCYQERLFPTT